MPTSIPQDQSSYWSEVAWAKDFTHPLRAELVAQHVPKTSRILDLGCGYGRLAAQLATAGFEDVVGVDSAEEMVRRGRRQFPDLDLRVVDGLPLPFADGAFGLVLLFSVLTCIPDFARQSELVSEVRRVLAPGGIVYVSDLSLQDDTRNRERYETGERRFGAAGVFELPEGVVLCHLPRARVTELFADFDPIKLDALEVVTMNGNVARAFQYVGRA